MERLRGTTELYVLAMTVEMGKRNRELGDEAENITEYTTAYDITRARLG
jgi:hypothetical protein